MNRIHRCRFYSKINNFKPVQHMVVSILYEKAVRAVEKEKTFPAFITNNEWPVKKPTLSENMLKCTELYEELEEDQGNDRNVLPCLLNA